MPWSAFRTMAAVFTTAAVALLMIGSMGERPPQAQSLVLVAPTFFGSTAEPRYSLTVRTIADAGVLGLRLVVVDASPGDVHDELQRQAARHGPHVHVVRQRQTGKKGVALREGIAEAMRLLDGPGAIAFCEPEKANVAHIIANAARPVLDRHLDVVLPARDDSLFRATYPIEQYHQERFTNLLLDSMAAKAGSFPRPLDWTFGPMVFATRFADVWLRFQGDRWDAQVVPMVRAVRWHGARVGAAPASYAHPREMKVEEEGVHAWIEKRLLQLRLWADTLPAEFEAPVEPSPRS